MSRSEKGKLHPRNRHQGLYDFQELQRVLPKLAQYIVPNFEGKPTVDFANPIAVKLLNQALLIQFYGIQNWDIPENYLCPPIPGRADYIHSIADLLAEANGNEIPEGPEIRVLDIGVGANCIYPIIGHVEYGWSFVGSDVDFGALESANRILESNPKLNQSVELRHQANPAQIFKGVLQPREFFDVSICNPPFHASAEEAASVNQRKWRNLGKAAVANFGGKSNELWCEGGEVAFVTRMINESAALPENCFCYTCFISKEESLFKVEEALKRVRAKRVRIVEMAQGQKKSRFVAWSFYENKV